MNETNTVSSPCFLQSVMLQIAASWIEGEKKELIAAKQAYMDESCPKPNLSGDQAALMVRHAAVYSQTVSAASVHSRFISTQT